MKKTVLFILMIFSLATCCTPRTVNRPRLSDIKIEQPVRPMVIVLDTLFTKSQLDSLYRADSLDNMLKQKLFLPTYPKGCYYTQELFLKYTDSVTIKYLIDRYMSDSLYHVIKRIE